MARHHGDAIRFAGFLDQTAVADTLRTADALVLPSFAEGVPVVLMEAMASGKPVIATQVGGVSELVEDGVSGHVVPPATRCALRRPSSRWPIPIAGPGWGGRARKGRRRVRHPDRGRPDRDASDRGGDGDLRPPPLPLQDQDEAKAG
jgi:hypothetical protein